MTFRKPSPSSSKPARRVAPQPPKTLQQRLWNPYVVVFFSSACIMIIELVASRLIAPRLGVSLYTWTTIIGVILAGISLGNYVSGRLADRYASPAFLGLILALAGLASLSILWLNSVMKDFKPPAGFPLMLDVVIYIAIIFFLPSTILGGVSPVVVKLSLTDLQRSGTTVGKIYAWSSVGSIVGTFATGFFLISWLGTKTILIGIAGLLLLMALWFLAGRPWHKTLPRSVGTLLVFAMALGLIVAGGYPVSECLRETDYYCINVKPKEVDGKQVQELILDRLVHSYSNLEDPTQLVYGYEKTYAQVIAPLIERKPDLAAFFIGGGGYTFPRYLEAKLPQSRLVVAEIDPQVTLVAQEKLGLRRDTRIEVHNLDARLYMMDEVQPASFDLVFGDAFNDYSVPFHLTTLEFDQMVARMLREDGMYVVNIIDGGKRGHFLRAYVRTMQQVFPHVAVIPVNPEWRDSPRMTFVIAGSRRPLDFSKLQGEAQPLSETELAAYMALEAPLVLRDDYVPVDNLLAPVFADSGWN
jgi:spermidine synthase